VPQLQSSPGVYLDEFERHSGYKYPVAEVVFQGLGHGEKSGFAVAGYLITLSLLP
jgi:hypothetical protein